MQLDLTPYEDKIAAYKNVAPSYLYKWQRCPRMFFYSRIAKEQDRGKVSDVLVFGNMVHYAMEEYFERRCDGHEAFCNTYHKMAEKYDPLMLAKNVEKARFAFEWCAWTVYKMITERKVIYLSEQMFKATTPQGNGISGRVDFTIYYPDEMKFFVIDFKGGFKVPDPEQLIFYKWWIKDRWPKTKEVRLVYLWFAKCQIHEATVTEEAEAKLDAEVGSMLADIHSGKFDPIKGNHCRWCGFKYLCPLFGGKNGRRG